MNKMDYFMMFCYSNNILSWKSPGSGIQKSENDGVIVGGARP